MIPPLFCDMSTIYILPHIFLHSVRCIISKAFLLLGCEIVSMWWQGALAFCVLLYWFYFISYLSLYMYAPVFICGFGLKLLRSPFFIKFHDICKRKAHLHKLCFLFDTPQICKLVYCWCNPKIPLYLQLLLFLVSLKQRTNRWCTDQLASYVLLLLLFEWYVLIGTKYLGHESHHNSIFETQCHGADKTTKYFVCSKTQNSRLASQPSSHNGRNANEKQDYLASKLYHSITLPSTHHHSCCWLTLILHKAQ